MKIWFDLTNSPHVSFFKQLISELKNENHEVIVTSRPLSNTIPLLELYNIDFTVVGTHYGKRSIKKILGFPIRVFQLYKFLKKNKPDIAIAQASYYLPVVAKMMVLNRYILTTTSTPKVIGQHLYVRVKYFCLNFWLTMICQCHLYQEKKC